MSKKQLRTIVLTAVMTTAGLGISSSALADPEVNTTSVPSPAAVSADAAATPVKYHKHWQNKKPGCGQPTMARMFAPPGVVPGAWNLGLLQNKHLSMDEARIIVQAGLLLDNRRDLKMGNISTQNFHERKFYIIPILDKQGSVVSTAVMNSDTGMVRPLPKGGLPTEKLNRADV